MHLFHIKYIIKSKVNHFKITVCTRLLAVATLSITGIDSTLQCKSNIIVHPDLHLGNNLASNLASNTQQNLWNKGWIVSSSDDNGDEKWTIRESRTSALSQALMTQKASQDHIDDMLHCILLIILKPWYYTCHLHFLLSVLH